MSRTAPAGRGADRGSRPAAAWRIAAALLGLVLLALCRPVHAVPGLVGAYFANPTLTAPPTLVRVDPNISYDYGSAAPDPSLPVDNFSVRWTGVLRVATTGSYTFQTGSDDGVRFTLNGALAIGNWTSHGLTYDNSSAVTLTAGVDYPVTLEYYDSGGAGSIVLGWKRPGDSAFSPIPTSNGTSGLSTGTAPLFEYRFEEPAWNGTASEVLDTSANGWHGQAAGLAATKPTTANTSPAMGSASGSGTCGYGVFNRTNKDYVGLPSTFPSLGQTGSYTATLWMRTADTTVGNQRVMSDDEATYGGSGNGWRLTLGVHGAGSLKFVPSQTLPVSAWVTVYGLSSNVWYFVAFGVDKSTRTVRLQVQDKSGTVVASGSAIYGSGDNFGTGDSGLTTLGGETNSAGGGENTANYGYGGDLDEVRVFGWALSTAEIETVRSLSNACPYTAAPTLIAEYRFEQSSWTGAAGELIDTGGYGGGPYNGTALNSPLPTPGIDGAARSSDPGTCGYATMPGPNGGGGNFTVTGLPTTSSPGTQTSVSFWMNWDGTPNAMPVSFYYYNLFLASGWFGFNTDASDLYGTAWTGLANGWHHVAATFTNGSVVSNRLYIDGVQQTLAQRFGTPAPSNASVVAPMWIGGYSKNNIFHFSGKIDELRVYKGGLRPADVLADYNRGYACASYAAPAGGFNAFETATAAASVTGVIHTKVAGSAFGLDLVALNSGRTAPVTNFYGTVKVELLDASDSSGALNATTGCRASWVPVTGNVAAQQAFAGAGGRPTVSQGDANAWRNVRVRVSYPASGAATSIGCSTDNFAIRPSAFTSFVVSDAAWATAGTTRSLANTVASGGNVHKAGQPFRVRATAVNAAATPATTTNYAGTPASALTACAGTACGGVLGTLTLNATAAAGQVDTSTASYSEAGAFALQLSDTSFAAVDASDGSTAAERTIASAVLPVGRFVPDHFDVAALVTPVLRTFGSASCASRSFTYVGQPFGWATPPQATVLARNAAGGTTANYSGSLWKLVASGAAQTYAPLVSATPGLDSSGVAAATLSASGNGSGVLAASAADAFEVPRSTTTPLAPFNAAFGLTWSVADASEAGVGGNGSIVTPLPLSWPTLAFDAGSGFRYGALKLGSAYGSELVDLAAPVEAQYWDGMRFATNTADHCTTLAANQVALGNYQRSLAACNTALTNPTLRLAAGQGNLRLARPGAGHAGSVDATLNLGSSASGQTCTVAGGAPQAAAAANLDWLQTRSPAAASYDRNPSARISFGQNKSQVVHVREAF